MTTRENLSPLSLPTSADGWEGWIGSRCDDELDRARAVVDGLKSGELGGSADILDSWSEVNLALRNAFAVASLMSQVHPDEARRTQAENAEQEAQKFSTDLMLDPKVYDLLASVDPEPLDVRARRMLDLALRDFRRAGVDRDEPTRQRLRELSERETELAQAFSRGIRDNQRTTSLEPAQLAGLPDDFVADHPAGDDGKVVLSTDYPDTVPFMAFAQDAAARRQVMQQFLNLGWPDNDAVLQELLRLRAEHASLLGYDGWADYDAEVKMIGTGAAIAEFIDQIAADAVESGRRDLAVLFDRLRLDRPDSDAVTVADWRYYAEVVRREQFDVDAQKVRGYFDFAKVRKGLLDVTGRLFGLEYVAVPNAPTWHTDVAAYDVVLDGNPLGRIYLDLHPRDGKYNHAAQFDLAPGLVERQLPVGVLVCNFPRGLMEHDDVVTLFHEFGHLLHHVLAGRQRWIRFSGVATEWDFVEAPSQMLEEWAWDAAVLRTFATNADGEPIPEALVEKMRAGNEFGKGYLARTQMFYAAVSYRLHQEQPDDITARVRKLYAEYNLFAPIEDTHFHTGFGHLEGYTSAYYTYMWSLVIAKDLFSAFDRSDLFEPATALRYRDSILAAGGSKDAADLVEDFLGRPYNSDAFRQWLET